MRPNTSGILQKYIQAIHGKVPEELDLNLLSLNYVLSDTRIHSALVGMRSIQSVEANARLSDDIQPRIDFDWLHERQADVVQPPWISPP